jgi:hypothetical protein
MDMTKFEDASDPGFEVVTGELRRWAKHSAALKGTNTKTLGASITRPLQTKQQDSAQCM